MAFTCPPQPNTGLQPIKAEVNAMSFWENSRNVREKGTVRKRHTSELASNDGGIFRLEGSVFGSVQRRSRALQRGFDEIYPGSVERTARRTIPRDPSAELNSGDGLDGGDALETISGGSTGGREKFRVR
ncbi:AMP-forming acyl-CoA synthetase [Corchorus olitorius]|uniref:AMP-forming acyl-CoA synthetase n=1 Tax=Corchorus olitorius TaxID=93759 RepID=A0A1R3G5P3_9ROSI|nr:AMP-forming acyl-CoA synthetase [Corchorus olitorius]